MARPLHPLVVVGDSLSQGFMSGAISRVDLSYGAMVARALGDEARFRVPPFEGEGGLPLNLEALLRETSEHFGERVSWYEAIPMITATRAFMARVERYWERGDGARPIDPALHHNLAVWGFEVRDSYTVNARICRQHLGKPRNHWLGQIPEKPMYRTAARVLDPGHDEGRDGWSQLDVAEELARQGGIERLVVALGANNALGTVLSLDVHWSTEADLHGLPFERQANLYQAEHFERQYARLADRVERIGAEHVFVATVPHVTIPPVTRGVSPGGTLEAGGSPGRKYYEYYTRPWIWDSFFNPRKHPHLTGEEARTIDKTIDAYNEVIRSTARERGWKVADMCGLLDSLAFRSSAGDPSYEFPGGLTRALEANPYTGYLVDDGRPRIDTRFIKARRYGDGPTGIQRLDKGGVFSIDGVHPGVIGASLVAELFLEEMRQAGAAPADAQLDWDHIVENDRLVLDPPALLIELERCLAGLEKYWGLSEILGMF